MKNPEIKIVSLTEYEPVYLPQSDLTNELEEIIYSNYNNQIILEPPYSKTKYKWKLTANGWVGRIPLSPEIEVALIPKVEIENIFGMLEYAYNLKEFKILDGLSKCNSLEDFYERLAKILALKILDRRRKGFYRSYKLRNERLPYVKGRMDVLQTSIKPWIIKPKCEYEEHTSNVKENQILVWTVQRILHSGLCTSHSLPQVRRAYQSLLGLVNPVPCNPNDCSDVLYNRLNQDYLPMHALCRFFLENSGPTHRIGDRSMLPFLLDMSRLYELFVAEWLKKNIPLFPAAYSIRTFENFGLGFGKKIGFEIDLVLYKDNKAYCVLDMKYKAHDNIEKPDFNQIVTYAVAKECREAILIYPKSLREPFDEKLPGNIRVRSMTFSLDGDLDKAGRSFINELFSMMHD